MTYDPTPDEKRAIVSEATKRMAQIMGVTLAARPKWAAIERGEHHD